MSEMRVCVIPKCVRPASKNLRGLCMICYSRAKKKVETGETTWEALEVKGLCESERDPFDDAYDRAMNPRRQ